MSARLAGVTIAAAIPCTTRAAISQPTEGASAHAADATPNSRQPNCSMRALPYTSASAPPISVSDASAST